jgi:hypothetical protein
MKKVLTAAFALSALFAASGKVYADVSYPCCLMGDTRGYECVFSSREQCAQDGRNRRTPAMTLMNAAQSTPWRSDHIRLLTVAERPDPQEQDGCRATFCSPLVILRGGPEGGPVEQACINNGAKADAPPCSEERQKVLEEELRHRADEIRRRLGEQAKP